MSLRAPTTFCCLIEALDVLLPLFSVRPEHSSIVRVQAIDFAFNIRSLSPDTAAAFVSLNLLAEFAEENGSTVVVRFVVLIDLVCVGDRVDGLFDVPETSRMLIKSIYHCPALGNPLINGGVLSDAAELALETDTRRVVRSGWSRPFAQ